MIGTELEQLLRRLVREELAKLVGVEPDALPDGDEDLRAMVKERAAKLRASKAGAR